MDNFAKRLRKIIGFKKQNQTEFARAVGLNPATVSEWLNGKTKPQQGSIEKIAEYCGVSAYWLKSGEGSILPNQSRPASPHNIPSGQRLSWLLGNDSIDDFAKKCNIPIDYMRKFVNGELRLPNDAAEMISKKCNVSMGWLTGGHPWQSRERPWTGLSLERHQELGDKLYEIYQYIKDLQTELSTQYPLAGKLSRPEHNARQLLDLLLQLRSNLEENYFEDFGDKATTHTYFGKNLTTREKRDLQIFNQLFESIISWCKSEDTQPLDFIDLFNEAFPKYREWRNNNLIIKNAQTGRAESQLSVVSSNEPMEEL